MTAAFIVIIIIISIFHYFRYYYVLGFQHEVGNRTPTAQLVAAMQTDLTPSLGPLSICWRTLYHL